MDWFWRCLYSFIYVFFFISEIIVRRISHLSGSISLLVLITVLIMGEHCFAYSEGYDESAICTDIIEALSRHQQSITISYPGAADDFLMKDDNDFHDLFERLSYENGYLAGIISGYTVSVRRSRSWEAVSFNFNYITTRKQERYIDKKVRHFARKLKGKSDFYKIKGTHDYLVRTMEYKEGYYNPYYAFKKGRGVCMSYALAFQRIMQEFNIPCIYVKDKNHAWNMVMINDRWYSIDVTWDDTGKKGIGYKYFLKGTQDFTGHRVYHSKYIGKAGMAKRGYVWN